jgi:prepilin-type N-terminal cleavage/methylation domain-containing protein
MSLGVSPMPYPLPRIPRGPASAFTLIELLTVIAVIGVLAGITLGVMRGVQERAAINLARTELAALSQALEGYKKQYGDYPQTGVSSGNPIAAASLTSSEGRLFNALMGKLGPALNATQGRTWLEAAKFTLSTTDLPVSGNSTSVANHFLDPWGRAYLYSYRTNVAGGGGWTAPSYILLSTGPDGQLGVTVAAGGTYAVVTESQASDNLYANR